MRSRCDLSPCDLGAILALKLVRQDASYVTSREQGWMGESRDRPPRLLGCLVCHHTLRCSRRRRALHLNECQVVLRQLGRSQPHERTVAANTCDKARTACLWHGKRRF